VVVVVVGCVTVVSRVVVVVEVTGCSEAQEVRRIAPKETTAIRRMDFFIMRFTAKNLSPQIRSTDALE
jgi:hypothetical protein